MAKKASFPARDLALAALLFATTLIAWFPALNGALLWDDDAHVTRPALRSLHGLWRIWFNPGATQQYYPLLHSAFWMEHRAWGDAVTGYHLTNVLLHATAALLVVAIAKRLTIPGAWLAGFLFALHPVTVESVAWISEQKSTLSAVFYLSSALMYLHFDQTRKRSQYLAALALFVCALLSKSVTATLPAALLVVFWWQRGKLSTKRDVAPLIPWFALAVTSGLFTAWMERTYVGAHGSAYDLSISQRILLAGRAIWFYLDKIIWPTGLMFFYPRWTLDPTAAWQYFFPAAFLITLGFLIWIARRDRAPLAALLFFAGTLFPALGFFNVYPFVYSFVADHFQYLASLGIIVPVAALLTRLTKGTWGLALIPALLAVLTWREARIYAGPETLYRETLARNSGSWIAHNNLGSYLLNEHRQLPEAISEFEATLQLKPDSAQAHYNLGSAYARMPNRQSDAIAEYETAIRYKPDFPQAHNNLGGELMKLPGRRDEGIAHLRRAVELDPDFTDAQNNLDSAVANAHSTRAAELMQAGSIPEAIAEYEAALAIDSALTDAHNNLGSILAQSGRIAEAVPHFEAAVRGNPDSAESQLNLASALDEIPARAQEAIPHYEAVIRLKPNFAEGHYFLGVALAKVPGRGADAIAQLEAAIRIKPDPSVQLMVNRLKIATH